MLITLVAVFISVALVAGIVLSTALTSTSAERKRLRAVTRAPDTALPEVVSLSNDPRATSWQRMAPLLGLSTKEWNRLSSRLFRAGYQHPSAPLVYTAVERIGPILAASARS